MRSCLFVLVLIVAILAGVAIGVWAAGRYLGASLAAVRSSVPTPEPGTQATPTAGGAARPPPAVAISTAATGDVTIEVSEADISHDLNQRLAGQRIGLTPLGEVSIDRYIVTLRDGAMRVEGQARNGPVTVPLVVTVAATASPDGRPSVKVTDAKLATVPVPETARSQIESELQAQIERQVGAAKFRVRSIFIGDGRLRVVGTPIP